jgi:hypothetical protein
VSKHSSLWNCGCGVSPAGCGVKRSMHSPSRTVDASETSGMGGSNPPHLRVRSTYRRPKLASWEPNMLASLASRLPISFPHDLVMGSLASTVLLPISPKGNGESRDCACYVSLRIPLGLAPQLGKTQLATLRSQPKRFA